MSTTQRFDIDTAAWQHQPRARVEDPFPTSVLLWLLPGLIGTILVINMFLYLEQRARLQVLFTTTSGQVVAARVDGGEGLTLAFEGLDNPSFDVPQWSPDGRLIATMVRENAQESLFVIDPIQGTLLRRVEAAPNEQWTLAGQAWSHDSTRVLVLSSQAGGTIPQIIPIADQAERITGAELTINEAGGIPAWHPHDQRVVLPVHTESLTPALHIMQADGRSAVFAPDDGQDMRIAATWAPNGRRIAYTARQTNELTRTQILVADQHGNNPQPVVTEHINEWPFWSPDGNHLFFTHIALDEEGHEAPPQLCRIAVDGGTMTCLGASPHIRISPDVDPHTFAAWSPNGHRFFFQSYDRPTDTTTVYVTDTPDGTNPVRVFAAEGAALAIRWAPTNRGLLVNDLRQGTTNLHWIDSDRPPIAFPDGRFPAVQPASVDIRWR